MTEPGAISICVTATDCGYGFHSTLAMAVSHDMTIAVTLAVAMTITLAMSGKSIMAVAMMISHLK